MKNKSMYYEVHKAKIYKDAYRPSSNIGRFIKNIFAIIIFGNSPISGEHQYHRSRLK